MAKFKYKAMTSAGKTIEGSYNAKTKEEVFAMLRDNKYYPVHVKESDEGTDLSSLQMLSSRVKIKDIAIFCRQFYTMLNAGVTIVNALDILRQQTENKKLKFTIREVYEDLQKGLTFSDGLKKHPNVFPELLVNMVEAGEVSGNLDTIMDRMASHYEKEFKINNKIKSAMVYPVILSVVAVGVVVFLLIFVMPTFMEMFEGSDTPLPAPTRFLLGVSDAMQVYWYIFVVGFIGLIIGGKQLVKLDSVRVVIDRVKFKLPVIKGTTEKITTSRFTRTLSTLSASGVPLLQALEIVANVVGNKLVADGVNLAKEEVRKGISFSKAINDIDVFPVMVTSMIEIGEESGSLDDILEKTAAFYDEELETALQQLTAMIEPLMIVVMAVVIGFIVIAMIMPMFDMYGTI